MEHFIEGALTLFSDFTSIMIFVGGLLGGMFFGAIPGVSMLTLGAIILPFTGSMTPTDAIMLYSVIYCSGVFGGAIADWADRRALLRIIEVALACLFALYAAFLSSHAVEAWQLLLMVLASGCVRALHHPVRSSYAFDLVGAEKFALLMRDIGRASRRGE